MTDLGIEFLSVFGLPPVAFVELADTLGCSYISINMRPHAYNPCGYPPYALNQDPQLRREFIAAMKDKGIGISLGEGFLLQQNADVAAFASDIGVFAELGAARINVLTMDHILPRAFDRIGSLAEIAAAAGLETMIEFVPAPGFSISNLDIALQAVRHIGRRDTRLMIDTMHFGRSGSDPAYLARIDPHLIGYVQLCDVPAVPAIDDYLHEALYERLAPGDGDMPLKEIMAAVPADRVVGLEVPMRSKVEAGVGPQERLEPCVRAARKLLNEQV